MAEQRSQVIFRRLFIIDRRSGENPAWGLKS